MQWKVSKAYDYSATIVQWWEVGNGQTTYRADNETEANTLCDLLNAHATRSASDDPSNATRSASDETSHATRSASAKLPTGNTLYKAILARSNQIKNEGKDNATRSASGPSEWGPGEP